MSTFMMYELAKNVFRNSVRENVSIVPGTKNCKPNFDKQLQRDIVKVFTRLPGPLPLIRR